MRTVFTISIGFLKFSQLYHILFNIHLNVSSLKKKFKIVRLPNLAITLIITYFFHTSAQNYSSPSIEDLILILKLIPYQGA